MSHLVRARSCRKDGIAIRLYPRGTADRLDPLGTRERIRTDAVPKPGAIEGLGKPLCPVALQTAYKVSRHPHLEAMQPGPLGQLVQRVRDEMLGPARRARRARERHGDPVEHEGRGQEPRSLDVTLGPAQKLENGRV